jgi:hypothetical protein
MKRLQRLILCQFFLYDMEEFTIGGHAALLGLNGSGKTALLDAIQVAMMGAHGGYLAFNTQSVGTTGHGRRNPRSLRDYCLGVVDDTGDDGGQADRKRNSAVTYITLVFEDEATGDPITVGVCLGANASDPDHSLLGLYILPGIGLRLSDHLESLSDGAAPLNWTDFAAAMRQRFKELQRTPFFTNQPMTYIRELLHALQPKGRAINERDYLKVFNKSVLLKNIDSVDTFVRDYVVEPQSIDRRRARSQIDHFKELSELLEKVKSQISELDAIKWRYEDVHRYAVRAEGIKALEQRLTTEERKRDWEEKNTSVERFIRGLRIDIRALESLQQQAGIARDKHEAAQKALAETPGAATLEANKKTRENLAESLRKTRRGIESDLVRIDSVIAELTEHKILPERTRLMKQLHQELAHQRNRFNQGTLAGLDAAILLALDALTDCETELVAAEQTALDTKRAASSALTSLLGQVRNADRNGAPISLDVAAIIERLNAYGIEAEPVCNLVEIADPQWQPAIEAYLKSNRESLVVAPGREREAVALIRKMPERDNPYAARVVQPGHLRDHRWDGANGKLVGNLLTGDNPVALAYLRSLFGTMRCVETEEDLERHPRALTLDGMLSANFTTSRMRLYAQERLLFGKRLTTAEKTAIQEQVKQAMTVERAAQDHYERVKSIRANLAALGDIASARDRVSDNIETASLHQTEIATVDKNINAINAADFDDLTNAIATASAALEARRAAVLDREKTIAATKGEFRAAWRDRRLALRAYRQSLLSANDQPVDNEIERVMLDVKKELDADGYRTFEDRLKSCENRRRIAENNAETAKTAALLPFKEYLDKYGVSLASEQMQWRNAQAWVLSEQQRLASTELHNREGDVALARAAAEEAFRSDVAVRMRESIVQMHATIKAINNTLATCPPFSNGERYRFSVDPAEAHKALHRYIMESGDRTEQDLFALGSEVHAAIMQLLDEPTGDKSANPLDDYRTLFVFDLMIQREGRKDMPLSKRLGVGSGGEHRAPFYVIAGAAMAAAYRLDAGKQSSGAGIILLDEAFHSMDQPNTLAAARFLDSIGLQMICAAPESDHSKLAPVMSTIFELSRASMMDISIDPILIKEPTHRLLTSDIPSEHPDLVTQMVANITSKAATP